MTADSPLFDAEALETCLAPHRDAARRIVFTNGCFDILHPGHVRLLQQARSFGDLLVLGLNSDESVRRLKGAGRPILNLEERVQVLAALRPVDVLAAFDEDDPLALIQRVRPAILVKGGDWAVDQVIGRAEVEGWGGRVETIPLLEGLSTSELLRRIKNGAGA
ncbi:MAG: D-glycero-beta-D-manno-heptose 1-phosphate adenylyltransferase [Gemmatimonadetes bacterium]|nr:D-glycero-beta-D-manno-heptose 1-phosphate adenylyltransferase [Gemmatimonadota bacterium]MCZ6916501.1 D-glycero-beta-D-manno-heptose 1-phosphate adenylyltransferase [Gemmatimonadota bacterium]